MIEWCMGLYSYVVRKGRCDGSDELARVMTYGVGTL